MLESIFGDNGAVVAQFLVILVFVLILTGVGYWLFQRYYGSGLAGSTRSRVPRLGVIDSMAIDPRHRLVLVRRDNVEHLLLISKSADLVVESSIVRAAPAGNRPRPSQAPRQQPQQPQRPPHPKKAAPVPQQPAPPPVPAPSQPAAPSDAAPGAQSSGISEPIPFPQNRRPQPRQMPQTVAAEPNLEPRRNDQVKVEQAAQQRPGNAREVAATAMAPLPVAAAAGAAIKPASAHFEEPSHPTRVEPVFSPVGSLDESAAEPATEADRPVTDNAEETVAALKAPAQVPEPQTDDQPTAAVEAAEAGESAEAAADSDSEVAEIEPDAEASDEDTATTVSNLEQEMARLLGEITAKRDG